MAGNLKWERRKWSVIYSFPTEIELSYLGDDSFHKFEGKNRMKYFVKKETLKTAKKYIR